MRVLDSAGARALDRWAIEGLGIPPAVLMENAAIGCVEALLERWPEVRRVTVLCGPGNNGGDGYAIARHLATRGLQVALVGLGEPRGDAALQLAITQRLGLELHRVTTEADLARAGELFAGAEVLVDALFGTGLARPLEGLAAAVVIALGEVDRPILAVDLPSGLDASRAALPSLTVWADLTVTFAAPKIAHLLAPASEACGEVVVTDLGFPLPDDGDSGFGIRDSAGDEGTTSGGGGASHDLVPERHLELEVIEPTEVHRALPPRPRDAHKGDAGRLLIVAGSQGMAGAAVLAARAALRAGAGLVTLAVPEPIASVVAAASVESMTLALPADAAGRLAPQAVALVLEAAACCDAVAVGPGLGGGRLDGPLAATMRSLVLRLDRPLVLDADGLNAFAGHLDQLATRRGPSILTPHPGELARLTGTTAQQVQDDRLDSARTAAAIARCVVVLKGRQTLVATPAGRVAISPVGNPGMATGGSGDVLAGIAAALLAAGLEAELAARVAVYWHGHAGDLAAARHGERGLVAGDLIDSLGAALADLEDR